MRVALFCATRRGLRCLRKVAELRPDCDLTVVSFREEPWEPPFMDDIRAVALERDGRFLEARKVEVFEPVDLILAVNWRYVIPPSVYHLARRGAYVLHDSLLPEYRGFSPTVWAIIDGADHTGATLFQMAEEVDAGDIVAQVRVPIGPDEVIGDVMERVTQQYLRLLEEQLDRLLGADVVLHPQDHARATHRPRRTPADNRIDWTQPCKRICNLVRAVSQPYPGAFTHMEGRMMRVWSARPLPDERPGQPGNVVSVRAGEGVVVSAADGCVMVREVQLEGGGPACASDVLTRAARLT